MEREDLNSADQNTLNGSASLPFALSVSAGRTFIPLPGLALPAR
jgi:hypothetical protein